MKRNFQWLALISSAVRSLLGKSDEHRIDIDDSEVVAIQRETSQLVIQLNQTRNGQTRRVTIRANGDITERAEYYIGHNVTATHPNPRKPLDYVEYAASGLSGYEWQAQ